MKPSSPIRDTFHIPFSVIRTLQFCLGNQDKYWDWKQLMQYAFTCSQKPAKLRWYAKFFINTLWSSSEHFNFIYIKFKIKCVTTYLHKKSSWQHIYILFNSFYFILYIVIYIYYIYIYIYIYIYQGSNINACPGQVNVLDGQMKEKFTCPIGQVTRNCQYQKTTITAFICDIAFVIGVCDVYRLR